MSSATTHIGVDEVVRKWAHKDLISEDLWEALTQAVRENFVFQVHCQGRDARSKRIISWRIVNETLGFMKMLSLCDQDFSPALLVDIGWHEFILDTVSYSDFCEELGGGYIHHKPGQSRPTSYTTKKMEELGIAIDHGLWAYHATHPGCCGGH